VEIDTVSESGHLLCTDNYEETSDKIISFLIKDGCISNNIKLDEVSTNGNVTPDDKSEKSV
jgi:hypothetical protein